MEYCDYYQVGGVWQSIEHLRDSDRADGNGRCPKETLNGQQGFFERTAAAPLGG